MTEKQLFLLDGTGAILSALMLGAVLLPWQSFFGMPGDVLRLLTVIAVALAIYSWSCYFLVKADWPASTAPASAPVSLPAPAAGRRKRL